MPPNRRGYDCCRGESTGGGISGILRARNVVPDASWGQRLDRGNTVGDERFPAEWWLSFPSQGDKRIAPSPARKVRLLEVVLTWAMSLVRRTAPQSSSLGM